MGCRKESVVLKLNQIFFTITDKGCLVGLSIFGFIKCLVFFKPIYKRTGDVYTHYGYGYRLIWGKQPEARVERGKSMLVSFLNVYGGKTL
jgi:hypothetical protein